MPNKTEDNPLSFLAIPLAWLVPGAGHLMLGQRGHGILFAVTIHLLFAAGLFLGGIRAINPPDQPIWVYSQFLAGWPTLVSTNIERRFVPSQKEIQDEYLAAVDQRGIKRPEAVFGDTKELQKLEAFAKEYLREHPLATYDPKVQDVGAVYCGIAGMLNLLVLIDVVLRVTGTTRHGQRAKSEAAS